MENTNSEDKEKIRIMPPVIFFLCLVMGLLLQWLYPLNIFPSVSNLRLPIALPIVFIAGITAAIARRTLNINNAGLLPGDKSNKLITKGIFSISRNPMYLSLVILLLGLAFLINSYYLLIMIPFFIPIMQYGVIIKEERLLATHFGNETSSIREKSAGGSESSFQMFPTSKTKRLILLTRLCQRMKEWNIRPDLCVFSI